MEGYIVISDPRGDRKNDIKSLDRSGYPFNTAGFDKPQY